MVVAQANKTSRKAAAGEQTQGRRTKRQRGGGKRNQDAPTADARRAIDGLLDELVVAHDEREQATEASEGRAWKEGDVALRLFADHGLPASRIAAGLNEKYKARPTGRRVVKVRWVQRLLEVQRVFPDADSRLADATWGCHAIALDIARITLRLRGRQFAKASEEKLKDAAMKARELLEDAHRQPDTNPGDWLKSARTNLTRPAAAARDSNQRKRIVEAARRAARKLMALQPTQSEIDDVLAVIGAKRGDAA